MINHNPQHTPGPWTTDPEYDDENVLGADNYMVADCLILNPIKRPLKMIRANAALIASAPEMLEMLEDILSRADDSRPQEVWDEISAVIKKTKEAI